MLFKFLVLRYLRFDKTQPFISITAILAFLGVGIGVMVLIVAMAIMDGMIKHIESKLFTMNYPLTIFAKQYGVVNSDLLNKLESKFINMRFSPYVRLEGAIKIGDKLNTGIIYGVIYDKEILINDVFEKSNITHFNKDSIVIGERLTKEYPLSLGSRVTLVFTQLQATGVTFMPNIKRFNVNGFFTSGLSSYDSSYMYANIAKLQDIKNIPPNVYDGIHIYSKDPMSDIYFIKKELPDGVGIVGWWEQNGNFFNAITLEKRALFIVLMLIIIMASLNIISSLMMVIMTRRREIALLLSLGVSKQDIKKIFFWLGSVIGGSGIVLGVFFSFVLLFLLDTFPIISLPSDVYGSSKLPLSVSFIDIFMVVFGAICIVLISSYYPSSKASRIDPLTTLRSE